MKQIITPNKSMAVPQDHVPKTRQDPTSYLKYRSPALDRWFGRPAPRNLSPIGKQRFEEDQRTYLGSFKKGGKVNKTGGYKLHKGERVLNVKEAKQMALEKKKGKMDEEC